eukprot:1427374-Alexandrium_andersonii.AAC.1
MSASLVGSEMCIRDREIASAVVRVAALDASLVFLLVGFRQAGPCRNSQRLLILDVFQERVVGDGGDVLLNVG